MSARQRATDDVPLGDLVVGEPAVHRVLDAEAARAKADRVVREASADPRIAAVVDRIGDAEAARPEQGDASVREAPDAASEIQRPTQRIEPGKQVTARGLGPATFTPDVDTHKRVTDPRLDRPPVAEDAPSYDEVGEAVDRASKSLRASAGQARADHQRLAVLAATALAVGLILLALLLTGKNDRPAPTPPATDDPGLIPVETVLPLPVPPTTAAAPTVTPVAPVASPAPSPPSSQPAASTTPTTTPHTPQPDRSATPPGPPSPPTPRPEPPKSSAPKPGPGQDVPDAPPKPSSDRPF